MRELKFKAFLANGKMSKSFGLAAHEIDLVNAHIMQYTGIKDVNNNEIYEGDIVKSYHGEFEEYNTSQVEFNNGTFSLGKYWKDGIHDWYSMEQYSESELKIIGNIHENPELI